MFYLPGHGQLGAIKHYLNVLGRPDITDLGQALGLWYITLRDLPPNEFLDQVMTLWLNGVDDVSKKGTPSWKSLVKGLRDQTVRQNGIANKIAKDHRTHGMFALLQYMHTYQFPFLQFCFYNSWIICLLSAICFNPLQGCVAIEYTGSNSWAKDVYGSTKVTKSQQQPQSMQVFPWGGMLPDPISFCVLTQTLSWPHHFQIASGVCI